MKRKASNIKRLCEVAGRQRRAIFPEGFTDADIRKAQRYYEKRMAEATTEDKINRMAGEAVARAYFGRGKAADKEVDKVAGNLALLHKLIIAGRA